MFLVVGLGNPGDKYKNNRHNIGFILIDSLVSTLGATIQNKKDFHGELYRHGELLFLKPSTFMNLSGDSVKLVLDFYKLSNFLVLHDDLDLDFGVVKFKYSGGSGGHNGLKSIDSKCGKDYYRLRYGIGKPDDKNEVADYVLSNFNKEENLRNQEIIDYCLKPILEIAALNSHLELSDKIASKYTKNFNKELT